MLNFNEIKIKKEISSRRSPNKVYIGEYLDQSYIIKEFYSLQGLENENYFYNLIDACPDLAIFHPYKIEVTALPPKTLVYEYVNEIHRPADEEVILKEIYSYLHRIHATPNLRCSIDDNIIFEYKEIYANLFPYLVKEVEDVLRFNCAQQFLSHQDIQVRNVLFCLGGIKIIDVEHARFDLQYVDLVKFNFFDFNTRHFANKMPYLCKYLESYNLSLDGFAITLQIIAYKIKRYIELFPNGSREEQWILEQINHSLAHPYSTLVSYLKEHSK